MKDAAESKIEILASPMRCFETISDYASYPQWQSAIKEATILDYEDDRPSIVEYKLDAMLKIVEYTLRYEYRLDDPKNLFFLVDFGGR